MTTTLERTKVLHLTKGQAPYHEVDGHWVTSATPVYAHRAANGSSSITVKPGPRTTVALTNAELKLARAAAKKYGWRLIERRADIVIEDPERWPHLEGDLDCHEDLLDALERVAVDLSKLHGRRIVILVRSGARTLSEQWALYNLNMNVATGKPKPGRPLTAYPNPNAPHVRGIAADCGIEGKDIGDFPGALEALKRHTVGLPQPGEDWHTSLGTSMVGGAS